MRKLLFNKCKTAYIESDMQIRSSKGKRSKWVKTYLKLGNKRIRYENKHINNLIE